MLPPLEECKKRIEFFDHENPNSTFDEFWRYKLAVETSADSILDDSHLDDTVTRLVKNLLLGDKWELWKTGVASFEKIEQILKNIASDYNTIKNIKLGDGQVANESVRGAISNIYANFHLNLKGENWGVTHNCHKGDSPNNQGGYFILGRTKVMMFIWGQTPGFDPWIRGGLKLDKDKNKYTPEEFCDIIKKLDSWVAAWDTKYKKENGISFQDLCPKRPIGRIIDIIYWKQGQKHYASNITPFE